MVTYYLCILVNDLVSKAAHDFLEFPVVLREGLRQNLRRNDRETTHFRIVRAVVPCR